MVFVRGQAQDYDLWAQLGNRGWSYEDVLPLFKKMESYQGGTDEFCGCEGLLVAMRKARELMTTPPLGEITGEEIAPGAKYQTDEELLEWVRNHAETTYHPVGTCKMGNDPLAVVDDQLRVHGIQGLRVADASIMPTLTSGNTNAPSIMIGEKCAAMVLAAAQSR